MSEPTNPPQSKDPAVSYRWSLSRTLSKIPVKSIILTVGIIFLFWAFLFGGMYQFYASILFGLYFLTHSIWISVVLLGVSQTFLMVPLRMMRVIQMHNISKFKRKVDEIQTDEEQQTLIKQSFTKGNRTFLFYVFDFVVQFTTFFTIGRLFLTDFYHTKLPSDAIFKFIPYPRYPIRDKIFKIPYPKVVQSTDYGLNTALLVVGILIIAYIFFNSLKLIFKKYSKTSSTLKFPRINPVTSGFYLLVIAFGWYITRNFPTQIQFGLFTGDVSIPNRTLNFITALATFGLIFWFGYNKIQEKGKRAAQDDVSPDLIDKIQQKMFNKLIKDSVLIGLGAFLITNQIPSAFELSIFTLEIISLLSPLTLDKIILKNLSSQQTTSQQKPTQPPSEEETET